MTTVVAEETVSTGSTSVKTFGEVNWSDDFGDKKSVNSKDLFLRLDEGTNEVRLVTQPFQTLVHKYKKEGDPGYGQKVYCSQIHGSCPCCDLGDKAKPRWLLGVIARKTGTYKILDISYAVFSQIRKLAKNTKSWGDPTKYDIDIFVDKNGGATGYYSVQPVPKEPLSAADQQIKDNVDFDDLKRRVSPPTAEQVQKRLDKLNGEAPATVAASPNGKSSKAQAKPAQKTPSVSMTDDEVEETFPDHNSQ